MFNLDHILWLVVSGVMVFLLTFFSVRKKWSFKKVITIMAIIAIVSEVYKIATHMFPVTRSDFLGEGGSVEGYSNAMYLLPKSLPFHLCSILIFFIFYLALSNNQKMIEKVKTFVVPVFVIAGGLAIIINTSFKSSINNFESFIGCQKDLQEHNMSSYLQSLSAYQYFPYHAGILWVGLYLIITKQVKFGLKEWLRNDVILFALLVFAIWINSFFIKFQTNFMFVVCPPADNLPLLNLDHGWYVYMVHYMFVGAFLTFLFQLPWIIKEFKTKK